MGSSSELEGIFKQMEAIVSASYLSTTIFERIKSAQDPFPYELETEQIPYVVVMPGNREEISEIMKFATAERVPVL